MMSIFTGITIVNVLFLLTIARLVYQVCCPTSPSYGQFVEDKTTKKEVILLLLQTQPADSNNGFKKVILCQ